MTLLSKAVAVAIIAIPAFSYAQSTPNVTRAQVRTELAQLEKAGYNPNVDEEYPRDVQRAEAIVAAQKGDVSGYGSDLAGTTQSRQ
ncbi:protein of unknown function [Paraburkholderia fungorum]|uniref:DUF4148 domain-containing protein n=1 Tax=Paraburkholderia fungorum TaxID=134537 RepID=A0A1H1JH37_9BURK|nr:DUF4148 domain-containing protein [Paraburkholderia fungorum]SDR48945.1 protein of unknown function [Paraburkholderia fungorum]